MERGIFTLPQAANVLVLPVWIVALQTKLLIPLVMGFGTSYAPLVSFVWPFR